MIKENLDVVVFVDLSGSIDDAQKQEFVGECVAIADMMPNVTMTLVTHDSVVCAVNVLQQANRQKIETSRWVGGGGTSHIPCFAWLEEHRRDARVVVCLTDGYTEFPEHPPRNKEVLWVLSERGSVEPENVPWGKVIKMERGR